MNPNRKKKGGVKCLLFFVSLGTIFFVFHQNVFSFEGKVRAVTGVYNISLQWEMPILNETEGVMIVRQKNNCSKVFSEKDVVYRGSGSKFIDNDAKKDTAYCYSVFLYDSLGSVLFLEESGLVRLKTIGEYVQVLWEDNIFIGIGIILIIILSILNIRQRKIIKAQA